VAEAAGLCLLFVVSSHPYSELSSFLPLESRVKKVRGWLPGWCTLAFIPACFSKLRLDAPSGGAAWLAKSERAAAVSWFASSKQ
jgi:hypothetical protein